MSPYYRGPDWVMIDKIQSEHNRSAFGCISTRDRRTSGHSRPSSMGYARPRRFGSTHQHVLELPRIIAVQIFRKQPRPADERRPVGVLAEHVAEIRHLDVQAAAKIHLVGF